MNINWKEIDLTPLSDTEEAKAMLELGQVGYVSAEACRRIERHARKMQLENESARANWTSAEEKLNGIMQGRGSDDEGEQMMSR